MQELIKELLNVISELSKVFFTKTAGIDPLFQRAIVPILVQLFRAADLQIIQLAALKALGSFVCQACLSPMRSQNLYRDLVDQNIVGLLCQLLQTANNNNVTAIHKVSVQVLSMLINPAFGNVFSFPWMRGPHD